jgi:arginyl-tRNA synthetase
MMGVKFDVVLAESMYEKEMKKVVEELKEKKILRKSQGAKVVNLERFKLGVSIIQKTDGSTLYATRDLASAISRYKKYKFDYMIYEVGQEQTLHFKQLFKILELMGYDWAKNCSHVSHGLYLGKDGKRLATRKGKTFFLEEIIEETKELAKKEIKKRDPKISEKELEKRALKITIAAIYYGDLKTNRINDVVFDLERFVSFEGDSGPYLLYSYARASSILRKAKSKSKIKIKELHEKEIALVKKLGDFEKTCKKAYNLMSPSIIANYAYQLAQDFNEFYHCCPVIGSDQEAFRLSLISGFVQVLKNSLTLLGIDTLERM